MHGCIHFSDINAVSIPLVTYWLKITFKLQEQQLIVMRLNILTLIEHMPSRRHQTQTNFSRFWPFHFQVIAINVLNTYRVAILRLTKTAQFVLDL